MAQKKTTTNKGTNSRSGSSSSKKGAAASRNARTSPKAPPIEEKEPLHSVIWSYSWGKALYLLLAILVMIGLDLLIAMNHYNMFFTVLGIEILAGMLIGWIVFLILDRKKQADMLNEESSGAESEE